MVVLSIGNFGTGWDGSICDEEHIASALEELGHKVIRWQRESIDIQFLEDIDHHSSEPDFILIAQWSYYSPGMVSRFKNAYKCPIVYWAFDYQADGQEWHEILIQEADLYLSKRLADSKYPNWRWLSQDFAPKFLDKYTSEVVKDIDVLFTGSYLPWAATRNETLRAINEKFNLVIHSVNNWPEEWGLDVRPPIMDYELPKLIARAKVNLAIDHTIEAGYWSDRASQIMACGGFVLQRYVPMMESIYRSHITYFFDIKDCLEALEYWLEHDEDREMIAGQAYDWSPMYKVKERVADMLNIVRSIL